VPERDHFFEVGLTHASRRIVTKHNGLSKRSSPGIDDTQVPGTPHHHRRQHRPSPDNGPRNGHRDPSKGPVTGFVMPDIAHAYGFGR